MKKKLQNVAYWVFIISALILALGITIAMTAARFGFIKSGIMMLFG